jgi:uncharacterized membrane protein
MDFPHPRATAAIAGHPIHATLVPFPIVCFTLTLLTDIAYWQTSNLMWHHFSEWLLLAGVVFGGLAALAGAIDFLFRREVRAQGPAWPHAIGGVTVLGLAIVNNLVHAGDGWRDMLAHWTDGRIKMYLTSAGLGLRRTLPNLFLQGEYIALETSGAKQNHVVAFARRDSGGQVIAVVPRLVAGLAWATLELPAGPEIWDDTRVALPPKSPSAYRNVFTGETVANDNDGFAIGEALKTLPVALLWAKP